MGYQTGTCENVYNIGNVTDSGEDTKVPARNAAGQIIGELNPDAGEINDYWHWYNAATPSNAVGSPSTYQPTNFSVFSSNPFDQFQLSQSLILWVTYPTPKPDYSTWTRNPPENEGFPVLIP
jgi:hypothetical protein